MVMSDQSPFLTILEAAAIARAPVSSVRAWIYSGKLRASRPGRRVLVRRDRLIAFLDNAPEELPPTAPATAKGTIEASRLSRRQRRADRRRTEPA